VEAGERYVRRPRLIELNLLPEEYRPHPWRRVIYVSLIALILAGAGMLYPLYMWTATNEGYAAQAEAAITLKQQQIASILANPQVTGLLSAIAQAEKELADYTMYSLLYPTWSDKLQTIRDMVPPGITIEEVSQDGYLIAVRGTATADNVLVDYGRALDDTDLFSLISFSFTEGTGAVIFEFTLELASGGGG